MYRKPDKEAAIRRPDAEVVNRKPELAAGQLLPGHPVPVTPSSGPVTVTLAFFICSHRNYLLILKMLPESLPIISSSVSLPFPKGADSPPPL